MLDRAAWALAKRSCYIYAQGGSCSSKSLLAQPAVALTFHNETLIHKQAKAASDSKQVGTASNSRQTGNDLRLPPSAAKNTTNFTNS
jgi:hypothetical protein